MGIMKKVGGAVAKKIANSDAVGGAINAAADTFGQTALGQTSAGRIARDIAQNPEHREGVIGAAIGMATPGIRNKFRAANTIRGIASDVRGGGGAVSRDQFGHLPAPPGGDSYDIDSPPWDTGTTNWDTGTTNWDTGSSNESSYDIDNPPWKTPDF